MYNRLLSEKINIAKAWGTPDNESVGYSSVHWLKLIAEMERYISTLESFISKNNLEIINRPSNFDDL